LSGVNNLWWVVNTTQHVAGCSLNRRCEMVHFKQCPYCGSITPYYNKLARIGTDLWFCDRNCYNSWMIECRRRDEEEERRSRDGKFYEDENYIARLAKNM